MFLYNWLRFWELSITRLFLIFSSVRSKASMELVFRNIMSYSSYLVTKEWDNCTAEELQQITWFVQFCGLDFYNFDVFKKTRGKPSHWAIVV